MTIKDNELKLDSKTFLGYTQEAMEALTKIEQAQEHFKEILEALEEQTEIPKSKWSAYFKAKFSEKLNDTFEKAGFFESCNVLLGESS